MASSIDPVVVADLIIYQGATFRREPFITLTLAGGGAYDLTNHTAAMDFKETRDSAPIVSLTHSSGLTLNGVLGTINLQITKDQTKLMTKEGYYWDVLIVTPGGGGDVIRLAEGYSPISPAITSV